MKVVILCGGQGTRLREETEYRPKPMVEIGGRPIVWHIMKTYAHYGFNEFILCLGYKGDFIRQYFINYEFLNNDFTVNLGDKSDFEIHSKKDREDWRVTLVDTGEHTLTGGRIKRIQSYIDDEQFMVTYGDGVANIDVEKLVDFHKSKGKIATLTGVHPPSRYGLVETDDNGEVIQFKEKPRMDEMVSAGFFVFQRAIFDYIPEDDCMLEHEPFESLAAERQMTLYHHEGYWQCMDTYRDFIELNEVWSRDAPWKVW
jgi:glucose-1-phosphate cytidylyltransferase